MASGKAWAVPDGLIAAITGPSGGGKTTTLGTLCQEYKVVLGDADGHARIRLREHLAGGNLEIRRLSGYDAAMQFVYDLQTKYEEAEAACLDGLTLLSERLVRELTTQGGKDTPEKGERMSASDRLRNIFIELSNLADPEQYARPRHIFFTCLEGRWKVADPPQGQGGFVSKRMVVGDEAQVGSVLYGPLLPGKFADDFGAWMTEHFRLIVRPGENGQRERWLVTDYDGQFQAKDASGRLEFHEPPHLPTLLRKIYTLG